MARFKHYDYEQTKMIPLRFADQIQPGTFEYTLNHVVDNELDLTVFESRYRNDYNGAPAYDPALLLKIVLFAYSRGITSSRKIAQACRENIIFIALSADSQPHHSTLADFISRMDEVIAPLFTHVLMVCDGMNLIGREMFAIDGCKLPSNAAKEWSGTRAELTRKQAKIDRAVARMLTAHHASDQADKPPEITEREQAQIKKLEQVSAKIKKHLATEPERLGQRGTAVKANLTDNDSAKMKTAKGVIQGYNGVAAVDDKHQIIVHAQAYGAGQEQHTLLPMLTGIDKRIRDLNPTKPERGILQRAQITADSGFHSEANMKLIYRWGIDGYIADNQFRKRDPRFIDSTTYAQQQATRRKERGTKHSRFIPADFDYDPHNETCRCPAGKAMWLSLKGQVAGKDVIRFQGYRKDCRVCPLKHQCLRNPTQQEGRQVSYYPKAPKAAPSYMERMKHKIDSPMGRHIYSKRLGTVEPVFGNLESNKGLKRFTLRGKEKVNAQWLLYCMVHNIEKIATQGKVMH
ncbi:IS1182 family transposase [Neptunomonas phycophila]|uniref:IS1182 family transposase n=2 Tax=Neptunomonas phycophila TaxID=1572645 RepID=UPI000948EB88|nr:IS1182 family transposase [Neptunomonas phycophila]